MTLNMLLHMTNTSGSLGAVFAAKHVELTSGEMILCDHVELISGHDDITELSSLLCWFLFFPDLKSPKF